MDIVVLVILIGVSFALAFLVESLVEYLVGTPMDKIKILAPYRWCLMYVAAAVGVLLALYFEVDLIAVIAGSIAMILQSGTEVQWPATPVGMVLSGLAISRGSNYLHQFLSKHLKRPDVLTEALHPGSDQWIPS